MANVIVKTFTIQESVESPATLYPRSDGRWGSFQNSYAVWPTTGNEVNSYVIRRIFNAPYTGTYYFRSTVDNSGSVTVDGTAVGGTANFNQTPSRVAVQLTAGDHILQFNVANGGDVAGFALTISNSSDSVIWNTRTYANASSPRIGRYTLTMPFRANITAYAWGAGGGGGGMDAGSYGGLGSNGLYNTHTFTVERGQAIEVIVGRQGSGGGSNTGGAPGGSGGLSRTAIAGDNEKSFNGGDGTASGPSPYSGGGGGGGGASVILVDDIPVLVAAGGGGGGGAGNDGNGPYARRDASINNNAMLQQLVVVSSNYNLNGRNWAANYFTLNNIQRNSIERGHNLAVLNPSTLVVESYTRYDTWVYPTTSGLEAALNAVPSGKIIALFNADAGAISSAARTILQNKYGSTLSTTWGNLRRSHAFIGIAGASFAPLEAFSDSSVVSVSKSLAGLPATEYRGENGQTKGGDGGGAGGGGGGYPGGQGGQVYPGDASGYAGQCGGNLPANAAITGTDSKYYQAGYAAGGQRGGGSGQPGLVVLEITPQSLAGIKVNGEWRSVGQTFVKVDGVWREVEEAFTKVKGRWRSVGGAGDRTSSEFTGSSSGYGKITRPYS